MTTATPRRLGSAGEADLWCLDLRVSEADLASLARSLAEPERERAARLARPELWRRYVAARAGLRELLGGYLAVPPDSLRFAEGPHGKPALAGGPFFSVSHSGELALYAVSTSRDLGVDVEEVRPVPGAGGIARKWFSAGEMEAYRRAGGDGSDSAFLLIWTRREAYLKAIGTGLLGLGSREEIDPELWETHELRPAEGYLGALVVARAPVSRAGRHPG